VKPYIGIYREPEHSLGRHLVNDRMVLQLVGRALEQLGVPVELLPFGEARQRWPEAAVIFSMVREPGSLAEIADWESHGASVFNSPQAVGRTSRDRLCPLLGSDGVPFPPTAFVPTTGEADLDACRALFASGAAWVKRADVHKACEADVVRIDGWHGLPAALDEFRRRGQRRVALQAHCDGDEVKFYGVLGGHLFWPYYPVDCRGFPFDAHELHRLAERAARLLGLEIYGGDAIIAADGGITLIDLNDWPSFAPCRGAAAHAIAQRLVEGSA
jgi:hypothetical protein